MNGNEDLDCIVKKIFSISAQEMVLIHTVLSQTSTRQHRWSLGPSSCAACSRLRGRESKTDSCVRVVGLLRRSVTLSSLSLHTWTHTRQRSQGKVKPAYIKPIPPSHTTGLPDCTINGIIMAMMRGINWPLNYIHGWLYTKD